MTDKELLTLAAKAAGGFVYVENMGWIEQDEHGNRGSWWNPFGDDGDALRLAVKTNIDISHSPGRCGEVEAYYLLPEEGWAEGRVYSLTEPYNDDPYAATRRAIVRAAAEIGRRM